MERKWTVVGCALWILGLAASIIGLNLSGETGTWVSVVGNIVFLAGLGITGAIWLRKKKAERDSGGDE